MPSPVICDLDQDGDVDIVYGGWDLQVHVWDMPFAFDRARRALADLPAATCTATACCCPWPWSMLPRGRTARSRAPARPCRTPTRSTQYDGLRLYLAAGGDLELAVFDVQGRLVRTLHRGQIGAGWHTVGLGRPGRSEAGQSSGVYFLRAERRPE